MRSVEVLIFNVGERPILKTINDDFRTLNEIVGGHLELIRVPNRMDMIIICNEEGKLQNLAPNLQLGHDIICGNFIVVRDIMDGEIHSLTKENIEYLQEIWEFTL